MSLSGGEVVAFEVDEANVLTETCRKALGHDVNALSIQPIPPGRSRVQFLVGQTVAAVRYMRHYSGRMLSIGNQRAR